MTHGSSDRAEPELEGDSIIPAEEKTKRKRATTGKPRPRKKKANAEERYLALQHAAYLKAGEDNFRGDPVGYWLQAEKELDSPAK